MATLIAALLLLALGCQAFRAARALAPSGQTHNPVLRRCFHPAGRHHHDSDPDPATDPEPAGRPGAHPDPHQMPTAAERAEADLVGQTLAGRVTAATYRERMSELAHRPQARVGGP